MSSRLAERRHDQLEEERTCHTGFHLIIGSRKWQPPSAGWQNAAPRSERLACPALIKGPLPSKSQKRKTVCLFLKASTVFSDDLVLSSPGLCYNVKDKNKC